MNVLITGITGFSGQFLLNYIRDSSVPACTIYGLVRRLGVTGSGMYIPVHGDLTDPGRINELVQEIAPDVVIHLAGLTHGSLSEMLDANVQCTENLLSAILLSGLHPRIVVIGSSAEYGYQGEEPISEDAPVFPVSIYGITKAAQTSLSHLYSIREHLSVCIVRPFNLIGPGQPFSFVCGNIVHQMQMRKKGLIEGVSLKGSNSGRDFIDIRDAVRAYWMLASLPEDDTQFLGIYNVGSGNSYSIQDIFTFLEEISGVTSNVTFQGNLPDLIPVQRGDISKIHQKTGWSPEISIQTSLFDMFTYEHTTA